MLLKVRIIEFVVIMTMKLNPTSLYITTTQLILKAEASDPTSWEDLYRLVPYLRNLFCCVVCSKILKDPFTPFGITCHHHVCRQCKNERKRIKPNCNCTKGCNYLENKSLRLLVQCYKKMCIKILNSDIFPQLQNQAEEHNFNGISGEHDGAENLIIILKEGAAFEDDYKLNIGISKSVYGILPCVYNKCTQSMGTVVQNTESNINDGLLYSVTSTNAEDNKMTIKRKLHDENSAVRQAQTNSPNVTKKRSGSIAEKQKESCRCGNATAIPGKLTCCGQRCPCYVVGKPCLNCKCRGCRNPHRPDGIKVRPFGLGPLEPLTPPEFLDPVGPLPTESLQSELLPSESLLLSKSLSVTQQKTLPSFKGFSRFKPTVELKPMTQHESLPPFKHISTTKPSTEIRPIVQLKTLPPFKSLDPSKSGSAGQFKPKPLAPFKSLPKVFKSIYSDSALNSLSQAFPELKSPVQTQYQAQIEYQLPTQLQPPVQPQHQLQTEQSQVQHEFQLAQPLLHHQQIQFLQQAHHEPQTLLQAQPHQQLQLVQIKPQLQHPPQIEHQLQLIQSNPHQPQVHQNQLPQLQVHLVQLKPQPQTVPESLFQSQQTQSDQQLHYQIQTYDQQQQLQQFQQQLLQHQQIRQQQKQQKLEEQKLEQKEQKNQQQNLEQTFQQQQMQRQQELYLQRLQQQELRKLQEQQIQDLQQEQLLQQQFEEALECDDSTIVKDIYMDEDRSLSLEELTEHLLSSNIKVIKTFPVSPELPPLSGCFFLNDLDDEDMCDIKV